MEGKGKTKKLILSHLRQQRWIELLFLSAYAVVPLASLLLLNGSDVVQQSIILHHPEI